MKRSYSKEVQKAKLGSSVELAGWAATVKVLGKIAFVKLRDREGEIQLVALNKKLINSLKDLTHESVIYVKGKVRESKLKSGGNEVELQKLEILSKADANLPIDMSGKIPTDLSKRLNWRVLDLRDAKKYAIFKLRSAMNYYVREYLQQNGFIEMQTPKIVGSGAEGGATLFSLDYYGKKAYLSQSQQLYKQMLLAAGLDKVYEIGPTFRAEKSHTMRHLAEFTQFDFEMAFLKDENDIMHVIEDMFVYVLKKLNAHNKSELEKLGLNLEPPKIPFPRVTYETALKLLAKEGIKIKKGDDIGTEDEKKLGDLVEKKYKTKAYFITKFPFGIKPFYIMKDGKTYSKAFDFEYNGEELASGGQREHNYAKLASQIKEKGLNVKDFEDYLNTFKFGTPAHGGFGLGIDRLVKNILNLDNIREAVLFPRAPERLSP